MTRIICFGAFILLGLAALAFLASSGRLPERPL